MPKEQGLGCSIADFQAMMSQKLLDLGALLWIVRCASRMILCDSHYLQQGRSILLVSWEGLSKAFYFLSLSDDHKAAPIFASPDVHVGDDVSDLWPSSIKCATSSQALQHYWKRDGTFGNPLRCLILLIKLATPCSRSLITRPCRKDLPTSMGTWATRTLIIGISQSQKYAVTDHLQFRKPLVNATVRGGLRLIG